MHAAVSELSDAVKAMELPTLEAAVERAKALDCKHPVLQVGGSIQDLILF